MLLEDIFIASFGPSVLTIYNGYLMGIGRPCFWVGRSYDGHFTRLEAEAGPLVILSPRSCCSSIDEVFRYSSPS